MTECRDRDHGQRQAPWARRLRAAYLGLTILVLGLCHVGQAAADAAGRYRQLCDHAADRAAREVGVPPDVLRALTRTETGRTRNGVSEPWPWTVNMEGVGAWFPDADSALAHVFAHVKRGARSFDIGCFQINHRWHGAAFASIEEMFHPEKNARYAAQFLKSLYAEFGDWTVAAGAYHSRTPELAERYVARFQQLRRAMDSAPAREVAQGSARAPQPRGWDMSRRVAPLIGAGATSTRGSLVPLEQAVAGRPVFALLTD